MYEKYLMLLERKGITSYQVSKDTGIPETVLSKWKSRDNGSLSVEYLRRLAAYFDVPMEYFLEDKEDAEVISQIGS